MGNRQGEGDKRAIPQITGDEGTERIKQNPFNRALIQAR